jgi:hypothetical protein
MYVRQQVYMLLSRNNDDTNPVGVRPRREGKGREKENACMLLFVAVPG